MKKSNKNWFLLLLLLLFTTVNTFSQVTEKCGTFSSEVLEKRGLGCDDRPSYTTEEFTIQSSHFIIHYTLGEPPPENYEPPDDGTTYVFAQTVSEAAEYAWNKQINELGWQTPPGDGNCGGGNDKYDIYIKFRYFYGQTVGETQYGTYGYTSYIEITPQIETSEGSGVYRPLTTNEIKVTIAHEFNHALQYRYNAVKPSYWFYENTATWMEEINYPEINEWITFFLNDPDNDSPLNKPYLPIDQTGNQYEYNGALFCHTMSKWKEEDVIKDIWEYSANSNQEFLYDINYVLSSGNYTYNTSLAEVLRRYAVWRYYTGDYDDGNHFDKANLMQGMEPLRRHNNGVGSGNSEPENLNSRGGTNYIVFKHANGVININFDGQNNTQFAAIGLEKRHYFSDVENNFSLNSSNDGTFSSLSCIGEDSVVLIPVVTEWQNQQSGLTYSYSSSLGTGISTSFWSEKENTNLNGNLSVQSSTTVNSGDSKHLRNLYQYREKTNQERFSNFQGKPVKHNNWNLIHSHYLLNKDFEASSQNNRQSAKYDFLENGKVQILPEGYLIPGQGSGSFLDPWYVLSDGTQPGNHWIDFTYQYEPNGKEGATEKGVFLGQPIISGRPYYKVDMPLDEEILNVNGQTRKFWPYKWTGEDVEFQEEYDRQTGIVFNSTDAIAKGILKGQLMSNDQNGIDNPSQRKMVRTDNGQYHVVYESMGTVFYTYSLTSNFYGAWAPDVKLDDYGKNPAIDFEADTVMVVFETYNPQYSQDVYIFLYSFVPLGNGFYDAWYYYPVTHYSNSSYYGNTKPVVSYAPYE
ncbi:MAG: hypothetical protein DRQ13_04090, partial [Ignavibacteriae bacterium]